MATFRSSRTFPIVVADLAPVVRDVTQHFQLEGYEVKEDQTPTQGWLISISKGSIFKAVLGMKTALNIEIKPTASGTVADAGVGIFGMQVIPTFIMLFIAWPILITQISGMVIQSKLDNKAIECIERSLMAHAGTASGSATGG